jgi:multidrug efflux pump subunit AcrA (membrane-fusion protein)
MVRDTLMSGWRVAAVTAVAGLAFAGCSKTESAQARGRDAAAKPVKIETVREEAVTRAVEVVGTLAAEDEVTVSSEADGAVSRIFADLGDRVKAGQVLVELDREKLQYSYDQQKAAHARALAKYGAVSSTNAPPIEQTPDVQRASAELVQAKQAYQRADELHKRQLVPKQALDDAEATLRAKQAGYDSALQNAKNLRADIDASEASMKLADRQLRDTAIRAPFDGYVQKRLVALGQLVKAPTPVMSLVRIDPLKVTAEIPERLAPWIKVGQDVTLFVDAYPNRSIAGRVSRISPAVTTSSRAFAFEALVPNGGGQLKPGTFARVRIETAKVDTVLTVPYTALQYRYGVNRVFVVNDERLAVRELKVGDRVGDRIEVVSGVKAGERVAVTDIEKLADGQKVSTTSKVE